jgi:hypothetical protein
MVVRRFLERSRVRRLTQVVTSMAGHEFRLFPARDSTSSLHAQLIMLRTLAYTIGFQWVPAYTTGL